MKSSVQVLKFGGTSVGNGERIRRVAHIVANTFAHPSEPFPAIIVSAMAKVTDQLLRIAGHVCAGEQDAYEHELQTLKHKHLDAVDKAVYQQERRADLRKQLETAFCVLEEDVATLRRHVGTQSIGSTVDALAGRSSLRPYVAAIAAWGERLSVLLVAASVADMGIPAVPVREEIIITGQIHSELATTLGAAIGADPLPEETRANARAMLLPLLEQQIVPIAAGFIGRAASGGASTLGRNGSDYSATVIGEAIDCVEVSIYTDVDGVLTADPRLVMNARLLSRLSYAEAARLSWFGAKVLHPRTLIPIAHRNIPVRVRNTFHPQNRGTVVGPEGRLRSGASAITVRRHLALVTVENTDLFGAPENAGQVFALAARAGAAPVAICSSSGHHLSFVVEEQGAETVVAFLQQEMAALSSSPQSTWRVRSRSGLAACACIGSGFTADPMSPARAISALARERIPVITQGASELGITLIVEDSDSERALRCLHRDLIAPVIPLVRHTVQEKRRGAL
ncbi:MAG: aspartate kinase [Ktedonobacteraceae bacterium]